MMSQGGDGAAEMQKEAPTKLHAFLVLLDRDGWRD